MQRRRRPVAQSSPLANTTSSSQPRHYPPLPLQQQQQQFDFHCNNNHNMDRRMNGSVNGCRNPEDPLPQFAFSEIRVGRMVGKGGFSVVSEVDRIVVEEVYDTSEEESQLRRAFASSPHFTNQRYVLKTLRTDLPEDEHIKGIVDLAIEADFLSTLSHPNIITMRAIANSDPHESRFFVILDRLILTLDRKFNAWRKDVGDNIGVWMGPCLGYCCSRTHELRRLWQERLGVARDIALALRYLHSQAIVYRDLKPDNCGFNAEGQVKLFDFGLAKRMDPNDKAANGLYVLTGNTGSLRYMAPEVANCLPYDQRVDAYSFGILFWQICSLTTPFAGFSLKMHADRVVRQGHRPKPDSTWPQSWVQLMVECWDANVAERPQFDHIVALLQQELVIIDEGTDVPSRASERIRAKQRKNKKLQASNRRLDVDTRIQSGAAADDDDDDKDKDNSKDNKRDDDQVTIQRFDNHVV